MRPEIEDILAARGYDYFGLPLCARLLLVTDGTVTELLEALAGESLKLGLKKQFVDRTENHPAIALPDRHSACLYRQITLRGEITGQDLLYAESVILHQELRPDARDMLEQQNIPLGVILNRQLADNHREIVDCGYRCSGMAADHLGLDQDHEFLYRMYRVLVKTSPIAIITEWFPLERISKIFSNQP